MFSQKISITKTKDVKITFCVVSIFLVLALMSFLTVINIITVIQLERETKNILQKAVYINKVKRDNIVPVVTTSTPEIINIIETSTPENTIATETIPVVAPAPTENSSNNIIDRIIEWLIIDNPVNPPVETVKDNYNWPTRPEVTVPELKPEVIVEPVNLTYSNAASESFFSSYYINTSKTDMVLDESVTALTFEPAYELIGGSCGSVTCNLNPVSELTIADKEIYYNNQKIDLPQELQNKNIINFNSSKLSNKWAVSVVVNSGNQEEGYVYLFDGKNFEKLITPETDHKIITRYNKGGGSISAGGSDNQFVVLYSGYEMIGYLFNNGSWQDISPLFNLRVSAGGFKSKIIRGGSGKLANWYICSDDSTRTKLIKLWQNNTDNIQGAIDLTRILKRGSAICSARGDREVDIIRSSKETYIFKDKGFNNAHSYSYQSNNFSSYTDKNILTVNFSSYNINAPSNLYSLSVSSDASNWQLYKGEAITFKDSTSNNFFIKAEFKPREADYSPWFNGLDLISYTAEDRK